MRIRGTVMLVALAGIALLGIACDPVAAPAPTARAEMVGGGVGWNQIQSGMRHVDVLSELGVPLSAKVGKLRTTWYYSNQGTAGARVVFDTSSMTVESWERPPAP